MEAQEPPEIAPDCWGKGLYLPSEMADGKRVWSFLLLNYFYKSWSIFKTKDSFCNLLILSIPKLSLEAKFD